MLEQFGVTISSLSEDKSIYCIPPSFLKYDILGFLSFTVVSGTLESSVKENRRKAFEQLENN